MTVRDEGVQQDRDRVFSRRVTKRCILLQVLGALLIVLACTVDWVSPDDPALPQTRSFMLLIGVIVGMTGLALMRR